MATEIGPKSFGTFEKQEPVSRKSRKLFRPEKPSVELRPANSEKPVFTYVVNGIKIKVSCLVLKIQRELCHLKCTLKVSGLSRNGPQA